jgi:hypothetical protein
MVKSSYTSKSEYLFNLECVESVRSSTNLQASGTSPEHGQEPNNPGFRSEMTPGDGCSTCARSLLTLRGFLGR